jgi:hypothetical protein
MLSWIIQITLISIILIFLVHHLIHFFKSTLTVPKVKDLVHTTTRKYDHIYNTIQQNNITQTNNTMPQNNNTMPQNNDSKHNNDTMKNELKNFLKKQMKDLNTSPLENFTETNEQLSYSTY